MSFFIMCYNPSNGLPIPLVDNDNELVFYETIEELIEKEFEMTETEIIDGKEVITPLINPLIKMGLYEIFECGTGDSLDDLKLRNAFNKIGAEVMFSGKFK